MPLIKLDYAAATGIAKKMNSDASAFGSNHQRLVKTVSALASSWSGNVSNAMQNELKDMNKDVAKIQETLSEMAKLAINSANLLKDTDTGLGKGISGAT